MRLAFRAVLLRRLFVRAGIFSWAHVFPTDYKRVEDAVEALRFQPEFGRLLASLVPRWASNKMMRGRRISVIVFWLHGVMLSVAALELVPRAGSTSTGLPC